MNSAQSFLFVPGDRADRLPKAAASGADCVVVDLEDAVHPANKAAARDTVAAWIRQGGHALVRINGAGTAEFAADLEMAASAGALGVMLPKADAAALAATRSGLRTEQALIALVETVAGFAGLRALAATPGLTRIAFGSLDFGLDAGIPGTGPELDAVRTALVIESRLAGLPAPIDGVMPVVDDAEAMRRETLRARNFGFGGKLCIHPRQLEIVTDVFAPTPLEVRWAEGLVTAASSSRHGAFLFEGRMVDRPVLAQAQAILARVAKGR